MTQSQIDRIEELAKKMLRADPYKESDVLIDYVEATQPGPILALLQERRELVEALSFYSTRKFYCDDNPHALSGTHENTCTVIMDEGKRARAALAKIQGEVK
jgi:hypothetical protein